MAEDSGRVNPYRFGVLEGNHVEDRFSLDHVGNQVEDSNKKRGPLPPTTMKDDYRWYNSALFHQRDAILENNPELVPQVYNNKGLKPFLEKPAHLAKNEALVKQAAFTDKQQAALGGNQSNLRQTASLYVCCPQGRIYSSRG